MALNLELNGKLLRKALVLSVARLANWTSLMFCFCRSLLFGRVLIFSICLSTLLHFFILRGSQCRRNCCPALLIALIQIGPLLEIVTFCAPRQVSDSFSQLQLLEMQDQSPSSSLAAVSITQSFIANAWQFGGSANPSVSVASEQTLDLLHKLSMAQLPELLMATTVYFWVLLITWDEAQWRLGLIRDGADDRNVVDIGAEKFNALFWDSPNAIIRRTCATCCATCTPDYRIIYYKRLTSKKEFEPYEFMKSDWGVGGVQPRVLTKALGGPPRLVLAQNLPLLAVGERAVNNTLHCDFDIYSKYADALAGFTDKRWTSDQWSTFRRAILIS